jgi:NAD(P)-dependent dehydrogenase (short-subunit alcohol dehydrogenase family)
MNTLGCGEARFVRCDVTDTQQISDLVMTAVKTYGRLDCLVNNAGGYSSFGSIDESSEEDFFADLRLNLVSNFIACKNALPHLRKVKGNIINVASLGAVIGDIGSVAHIAAKGGVIAMTKALAVDESKYGVRVNCLLVAHVQTAMWQDIAKKRDTQAKHFIREAEDHHLIGRMGTPEECGKACLFLAADATFSTGTNLSLSGGAELNYASKSRLHFM